MCPHGGVITWEDAGVAEAGTQAAAPGKKAIIDGLVSRPDLNGKEGALVQFDSDEGRWVVLLEDDLLINVNPANLKLVQECKRPKAKRTTTVKAPRSNGDASGAVTADTRVASPGKMAVLHGLTSQPGLNSKECQLVTFDNDKGLWIVLVASGEIITVKLANLNFANEK